METLHNAALVVNDQPASKQAETEVLHQAGIEVTRSAGGRPAIELARHKRFDVVLMDLPMTGLTGLETLRELKRIDPTIPIILFDDALPFEEGETELEDQVFGYLRKPIDANVLLRKVREAIQHHRLACENQDLPRPFESENRERHSGLSHSGSLSSMAKVLVGQTEAIAEVRSLIAEVAPTDMTVLIDGETGTGKDVVARLIHTMSARAERGDFVKISCPAVPEQLIESELFGHEAGAFTGAQRRKPGRLELGAGGSAFLDEISELPATVQAKLLQVLEDKQFTRLGGNKTITLDIRLLAAANNPLDQMCSAGRFRSDLYFRLNQFLIHLPPLRERIEDIPLLVGHFLKRYGPIYGNNGLSVSNGTLSYLVQHPWPGNVRELETAVRRFALTGREEVLRASLQEGALLLNEPRLSGTYRESEKKIIMAALLSARWNRRRAAEILGMSYNTLRRRIEQYGLANVYGPPPNAPRPPTEST